MKTKSIEIENAAWCGDNLFIDLIHDVLAILRECARLDNPLNKPAITKRNNDADKWTEEMRNRMRARLTQPFIKTIGVLAKYIRSDQNGYLNFDDAEWTTLYAVLFPEDGLVPRISQLEKDKIIRHIDAKKQGTKYVGEHTAKVLEDLIWGELFAAYQTKFEKAGNTEKAATRNTITQGLLELLPALAALAFTPIEILMRDSNHYQSTPVDQQIGSLVRGIEQSAKVLIEKKRNSKIIEKRTATLINQSTLFKSSLTIQTQQVKINRLEAEIAMLKGLLPPKPVSFSPTAHLSATAVTVDGVNTLINAFITHHEKVSLYRKNFFGWLLGIQGVHVKEKKALLDSLRKLATNTTLTAPQKRTKFQTQLCTYIEKLQEGHSRRNLIDIHLFFEGQPPSEKELRDIWTKGFLDLGRKIIQKSQVIETAQTPPVSQTLLS